MPRLSLAFDGSTPVADALALVTAAEVAGLDGVWSAEHLGLRDTVVPSAAFLTATRRIDVGLVGVNPWSRHPGLLAMEVASLCELAPGRVRLQVGTGDVTLGRRLGLRAFDHALGNVAHFARALRDLLSGGSVSVEAPGFALDDFALSMLATPDFPPHIALMAIRPKMVALAAEVGDGVALSMGASRAYIRRVVETTSDRLDQLGRKRADFTVSSGAVCAVDDDEEVALRRARRALVFAAAGNGRPVIAPDADLPPPQEVRHVMERRGPGAVAELISPDAARTMAVACTPPMLRDALARYAAAGVDELALKVVGPREAQLRTIQLLGATKEDPT